MTLTGTGSLAQAAGEFVVDWPDLIRLAFSDAGAVVLALFVLVAGMIVSYAVWRYTRNLLEDAGVPAAVEGTPFERTVRGLGTSTVGILATLAAAFVYVGAIIVAFNVSTLFATAVFWRWLTGFVPNLFVAIFALIIGFIVGDKAKLYVSERLRGIKFPEVDLLPQLVKYSVFYLAVLVALDQLRVATTALVVLLAAYAFGVIFLGGLAFRQLLAAGAAGLFLLLTQPYSIGDEVEIDDYRGVVQEVGVFVTHVESGGEEYVIPNQRIFESGVVRVRD